MPIPEFVVEIRKLIGQHEMWLPGVTAVVTARRRGPAGAARRQRRVDADDRDPGARRGAGVWPRRARRSRRPASWSASTGWPRRARTPGSCTPTATGRRTSTSPSPAPTSRARPTWPTTSRGRAVVPAPTRCPTMARVDAAPDRRRVVRRAGRAVRVADAAPVGWARHADHRPGDVRRDRRARQAGPPRRGVRHRRRSRGQRPGRAAGRDGQRRGQPDVLRVRLHRAARALQGDVGARRGTRRRLPLPHRHRGLPEPHRHRPGQRARRPLRAGQHPRARE